MSGSVADLLLSSADENSASCRESQHAGGFRDGIVSGDLHVSGNAVRVEHEAKVRDLRSVEAVEREAHRMAGGEAVFVLRHPAVGAGAAALVRLHHKVAGALLRCGDVAVRAE